MTGARQTDGLRHDGAVCAGREEHTVACTRACGELLREVLERRLPPTARAWCERAFLAAGASFDGTAEARRSAFAGSLAAAARWLGKAAIDLDAGERARLAAMGAALPASTTLDEVGRIAMFVVAAAHLGGAELEALVHDGYRHGDSRERQAVLRALPFLPEAPRFVPLAVDACRTHVIPVFEAIACDNPYPAAHFPDLNWNQMVLKALFLGIELRRVAGLPARRSPELERMADDYASERRAAGRSVPADIDLLRVRSKP